MPEKLKFDDVYTTFKLIFCNPDSSDVKSFMYTYEQVVSGRDLTELEDEIENNKEQTGYAHPQNYKP